MPSEQGAVRADILISSGLAVILAGLAIFSFIYYRNVNHDLTVLSEIAQLRSGLEINFVANTFYPLKEKPVALNDRDMGTQRLCYSGFFSFADQCDKVVMSFFPQAYPKEVYYYNSTPSGDDYFIQFSLKSNQKYLGLLKGAQCATREGIKLGACEGQLQTQ